MKRWLILLLICLLTPALAQTEDAAMESALQELETLGYPISDEAAEMALEQQRLMQELYAQAGIRRLDAFGSKQEWAYQLLLCQGVGKYDYDAMIFTPTSDKIYVFDAEFFNVAGMYTEFLQGVQAIIPDAQITAVREDLSGMNEFLEGARKVFFEFNGHSYVVTLKSEGDWFDAEMIDFLNLVLRTEEMPNRMHVISDGWDQMVFLIYGTEAEAQELRSLLGTEAAAEDAGSGLLNWLDRIFGN